MSLIGRSAGVALTAVILMSVVACSSGNSSGEGSSAVCEYRVAYQGRIYREVANMDVTVGKKLGSATVPACDDTGGNEKGEQEAVTAYAVNGVSPDIAVAVGDSPDETRLVAEYSGTKLPAEVKKLLANH
jgi:Family of unknown function (DUF6281)